MKRKLLLTMATTAALAGLAQPVFAQPEAKGEMMTAPGKAAFSETTKVAATVMKIDAASRTVTLKGPKGRVFDLAVGDEVRNFDQVKVGDKVVAEYKQALTLELKKGVTGLPNAPNAKPGTAPPRARSRARRQAGR
ncbi:hypothetical protein [Cupriavidus basilensis]